MRCSAAPPAGPATRAQLLGEAAHLLRFGSAARLPQGGFGWLDRHGTPTPGHPRPLYVTCRLTHSFALGVLAGNTSLVELVDHGLAALRGPFRDTVHGGWFTSLHHQDPIPQDTRKWAYPHAFVVLAAASATVAGRPGAAELLDDALRTLDERFWDVRHGMLVEEWDQGFTTLSSYRGANAAMHGVEAMLAAAEVTGRPIWAERARGVADQMIAHARAHDWRLPEHYDADWKPILDQNLERPDDPFKPYGATPGHSFEWARLLLHLRSVVEVDTDGALLHAAKELFDAAARDAWSVDGAAGLVYTVDWAGRPVIRHRPHWVLCEAMAAAATLAQVLSGTDAAAEYDRRFEQFWAHASAHYIDRERGSWHHELDPGLRPSQRIRRGKADIYHALQACLAPNLPLRASLAGALAEAELSLPPAARPPI